MTLVQWTGAEILLLFIYLVCGCSVYMHVCAPHVYLMPAEEGTGAPGTGVRDGCQPQGDARNSARAELAPS